MGAADPSRPGYGDAVHPLLVAGLALCAVGAVVHGYIFWLEAIAWRGPRARRIFGTTEEEARITAPLALNQGFYNLFLAVAVVVGIVLAASGAIWPGITATLIGAGSMVAAALVLVVSSPDKARAAAVQGAIPFVGVVLTTICAVRGG